ncbi:MAG TPA: YpdA family putative bacillithiol disulfide reductase [Vicinamibacterales bacterium]|jgi:thioredoxin reductase (NADPH)|nr:YpdA family putative bacillithiol disulfide reductase [Vicinamibacterales bacterium]
MPVRDLIIVGAGPSGLSAAIAAKEHRLDYQVLEQGVLVNSIFRFPPNMVFFTTPELLEIGGLPLVSPFEKPTRLEALRYYRRVVDRFELQIAYQETVVSVTQEDAGGSGASGEEEAVFALETTSAKGVRRVRHAKSVIFAIGYYDHPVMLGIPGEDLPHVFHFYSEAHPYYRQRVVIVGGGNSAAESALELHRAGAHVTLVHRWPELKSTIKYWVRPDIENRIKEGSIGGRFSTVVKEIRPTSVIVTRQDGVDEEIPAEAVFLLTGYRADNAMMARAGVAMTDREGPSYDPETFETNVPGLFVAGGALAGVDTGTIFIENGRFHGAKIVDVIANRLAAED